MAIDNALIQASLKQSLSKASVNVPDLTPLYKSSVETAATYYQAMDTMFKSYIEQEQKIEVGKQKQLNDFQKTLIKQKEKLVDKGETMSQKVVDALDIEIRRLQEEYIAVNTYGKDDNIENQRARTRLSSELTKVINEAYNARQTFELLYDQKDSWINGALDADVIAAQNKMMGIDIDNDPDVQVAFVNGKLSFYARNFKKAYETVMNPDPTSIVRFQTKEYMTGEAIYSIDEMKENFPSALLQKDRQILALVNDMEDQAFESGKQRNPLNFNADEVLSQLDIIIQTPEEFRSLGLRRVGMGGSDRNITLGRPSFLTELKLSGSYGIQLELMDATFKELFSDMIAAHGQDGVIDQNDLQNAMNPKIFRENYNAMISVLTNIKDENFDLNRSKKLLIGYFKNIVEEKYKMSYAKGLPKDAKEASIELFGKTVMAPTRGNEVEDYNTVLAIAEGQQFITLGGRNKIIYKFDSSSGNYIAHGEPNKTPFKGADRTVHTRHELINQFGGIYSNVDPNYDFDYEGR